MSNKVSIKNFTCYSAIRKPKRDFSFSAFFVTSVFGHMIERQIATPTIFPNLEWCYHPGLRPPLQGMGMGGVVSQCTPPTQDALPMNQNPVSHGR